MKTSQITVRAGDPLEQSADALIHPIRRDRPRNSPARRELYDRLDPEALQLLRRHEPLEVGAVVLTGPRELPVLRIAHLVVPSREEGAPTPLVEYREGLTAALYALDVQRTESCVLPRVTPDPVPDDAGEKHRNLAGAVVKALRSYAPTTLQRILLVDPDGRWCRRLEAALSADRETGNPGPS